MEPKNRLPWYCDSETGEVLSAPSPHSNLATLICEADYQDAEFIVRAVNCHADMLAALEGLLPLCVPTVSASKTWEARETARAAIERARGES